MPLTEIDVTSPKPIYRNYWTERAAAKAAAPPPPPWPAVDPGLLKEGRPKLPAFPLKVFPRQWREWVSDAAQWAGSSEDYIAQALLASVAGLCGQGVSARITEAWSEPVILWQALVGGPSSGKTPALEWLRRPLGTVERVLAREGGAPVVVSDAALPALEKAVAQRPQGVLLWRDEPTAWLAGLGRKSRRDESRRGPFLDTWGASGLPWGRDSTAVSILGSLDPERLDAALEGTGDGLAARFLYVWPGPAPYRSLRTLKPTREDEAVNALQRIARAVGTPEKPLVMAFEDQAVTAFDRSLELLHPETLKAEGFMAGWLGKGRGTVARLAAVLALLDWTANRPNNAPPPTVITTHHLCAAWDLWERYYRPHAQAVFDRAGPSDRARKVRQVIGWIRTRGAAEISREEVRREALSQRVNAAGADEVILSLEQAGVLREVDDEEEYPGPGRPARRWQVNPTLLAKPAAQTAESPSLPSAAGEVSSSYDACPERSRRDGGVGSLGSTPSAESLAQIAEKKTAPDSTQAGQEDEVTPQADLPPRAPAAVPADWPK
jgi:Protein of unknown function (DUF3987)